MTTEAPTPADQTADELQELFQVYKTRHLLLHNYNLFTWLVTLAARRAGVDPYRSTAGFLLTLAGILLSYLLPVAVVVSLTHSWTWEVLPTWIGVILINSVMGALLLQLNIRADEELVSLHAAIATRQGLRRLIEWDRRWFSYPVNTLLALVFMAVTLAAFLAIYQFTGSYPLPIGTQVIGAIILFYVGELAASMILLVCEAPLLVKEEYQVFRYDPAETPAFYHSLSGYNQLAAIVSLVTTVIILMGALILPQDSGLVLPVTLMLLGLAYSSISLIIIAPRIMIGQIVARARERELIGLQKRLNAKWERLFQLSAEETQEMEWLEKVYERLANSPDQLVSLATTLRTFINALFFPTLTTIVTIVVNKLISK